MKPPSYWHKGKKYLAKRDKVMARLIKSHKGHLTTPLKYLALIYAIAFGFFIFQEIPSFYTILGAGLIVVSSLIIFTRERQLKKAVIMPRQQ